MRKADKPPPTKAGKMKHSKILCAVGYTSSEYGNDAEEVTLSEVKQAIKQASGVDTVGYNTIFLYNDDDFITMRHYTGYNTIQIQVVKRDKDTAPASEVFDNTYTPYGYKNFSLKFTAKRWHALHTAAEEAPHKLTF